MAMFITVRFSKFEEEAKDLFEVFNPDCYLSQLLHSIRKRCACEKYDELVLADKSCNFIPITKLAANDGQQNGCSLFKERNKYVLMTIEKKGRGGKPVYKPLLGTQYIDEYMDEKLKALSNPDSDSRRGGGGGGRTSSLSRKKTKTKQATTK